VWDDLKDTSSLRATNPIAVKKAMDAITDKFVGYEQRDAHEFLSDLVDRVHDELEEETKESGATEDASPLPTDEFFRMNVQVCLTCDSCGYTRYAKPF
jgi:ubiquitin C-terminal hydrolase